MSEESENPYPKSSPEDKERVLRGVREDLKWCRPVVQPSPEELEVEPKEENSQPTKEGKLGWNWLWFFPLCALVLWVVERHSVEHGFVLCKTAYQRWSWGALFSPSAYFCFSVIVFSVYFPIYSIVLIWSMATADGLKRRYAYLFLLVAVVFLLPILIDAVTWGSFPFNIDNDGVHRLRLIPFIPWPQGPYGDY